MCAERIGGGRGKAAAEDGGTEEAGGEVNAGGGAGSG